MNWARVGAIFMAAGVLLGAFGSHALKSRLDAYSTDVYGKAVFYHLIHGLAFFAVAWLSTQYPRAHAAGWFFSAGIVLFSGSLYLLSVTGIRMLGAVTPLGGLCLVAGWVILALALKA